MTSNWFTIKEDNILPKVPWILRKSRKGDEPKIITLAKNAFGKNLLPEKHLSEFWDWEFHQNPSGDAQIWVADDNGNVVGHYAIIPVRLQIGGIIHTAGLVVDVITHSAYRYQGMFTELGRTALKDAGAEHIPFCMGFPMEGSTATIVLPGHFKVGWFIAFTIPVFVRPLNFESIVRKLLGNKYLARLAGLFGSLWERLQSLIGVDASTDSLEFLVTTSFPKKIDKFWEDASKDYEIIGVRDFQWLNYRFTNVPGREYRIIIAQKNSKILGYIILREMPRMNLQFGLIVDILTYRRDHHTRWILLAKAVEYFKMKGVDLVGCMIQDDEYQQDLKALGFIKSLEKYYFIIHLNTNQFEREVIAVPKKWFISWGDLDTI